MARGRARRRGGASRRLCSSRRRGSSPVTDIVSGVSKAEDGGILVDANLRAADGLYARGRRSDFSPCRGGERNERARIEHWARRGPSTAASPRATCSARQRVTTACPYFWTAQPDLKLHYLGHAESFGRYPSTPGDVDDGGFIAYYLKDGAGAGRLSAPSGDAEVAALEHLMLQNRLPSPRRPCGGAWTCLNCCRGGVSNPPTPGFKPRPYFRPRYCLIDPSSTGSVFRFALAHQQVSPPGPAAQRTA